MLRRLAITSLAALAVLAGGLSVVPVALAQNPAPAPPADELVFDMDNCVMKLTKIRVGGRMPGNGSFGGNRVTVTFDYSVYFKAGDGTPHPTVISQFFIGIDPRGQTYLALVKQGQAELKGSYSGEVPFASEASGGPTSISLNAFMTLAYTEAQGRQFVAQNSAKVARIAELNRPK